MFVVALLIIKIDKYSSCSCIIWNSRNFSYPTSTACRTPARNIVTIPSDPTSFAHRNIGTHPASTWCLVGNEAIVKHIQTVMKQKYSWWNTASAWRWYVLLCYGMLLSCGCFSIIWACKIRLFETLCIWFEVIIGDHLCIQRQCHVIVSLKSCCISDLMCEIAERSAWTRTDLLLLLKFGTSWLKIFSCAIILEKK